MIHKSKLAVNEKLHSLWNAAVDLTLPTIISSKFGRENTIPVFVTSDERLWSFLNLQKVRVIISDNNQISSPPFIEMDLTDTKWTSKELQEIDQFFDKVKRERKNKVISSAIEKAVNNSGMEDIILDNLRVICYGLEINAKDIITSK